MFLLQIHKFLSGNVIKQLTDMLKPLLTCLLMLLFTNTANAVPSNHELRKIMVGDIERSYIVHFPMNIKLGTGLPLVIVLHGGGGDAESIIKASRFSDKADKNQFIAVYPEGTYDQKERETWNALHCCGTAKETNANDLEFINLIIDDLENSAAIDQSRIYIAGYSNGGMLAHRLGAQLSERIAAIGVIAGGMFDDQPAPFSPLSVLIIHGLSDRVINAKGGESRTPLVKDSMDKPFLSAQAAYNFWRQQNGCKVELEPHLQGNITTLRNRDCKEDVMVVMQTVKHGGHNWFGSNKQVYTQFDDGSTYLGHSATDTLWDFFSAQRKR